MEAIKVLCIGGDKRFQDVASLAFRLKWPQGTLLIAVTVTEALEMLAQSPELVLLSSGLDGEPFTRTETIQQIRRLANAAVFVLGSDGGTIEVVSSLSAGADDYVSLPCDIAEIAARMDALLRRTVGKPISREMPVKSGELFLDPSTYRVFLGERRIAVTSTEFRLLHLLMKNRGNLIAREVFGRTLWRERTGKDALLKKYIQRLRGKLADDARNPTWISTVYNGGYRFIGPPLT